MKLGGQKIPVRTLLLIACDSVLIIAALIAAIFLRFGRSGGVSAYLNQPMGDIRFVIVVLICQLSLYYYDLYDFEVVSRRSVLVARACNALGVACLVLSVLYYVLPDVSLGRGVAAMAAPLIIVETMGWRLFVLAASSWGQLERVLVLGTGQSGISLVQEIVRRRDLDLKVVGFLDERGENIGKSLVNPGIIGAVTDVEPIVQRERVDRVVISLKERRGHMPVQSLLHLKFRGVRIDDAYSMYERLTGRILVSHLSPSWFILSDGFRKSRILITFKRAVDVLFSLFAILVSLPVMAAVALAVFVESGRPILFKQKRTGLHSEEFEILKFRSMYTDSEKHGPAWTSDGDRRITKVGSFIRRCRLDELPQFFNVLRGDMSLVGPRPEQPRFCEILEEKIPYYAQRHTVRPGITGWAQIKFRYGASIEESQDKLEYDLFYIKHLSVALDLAILFETVKVLLSGRGAK